MGVSATVVMVDIDDFIVLSVGTVGAVVVVIVGFVAVTRAVRIMIT